MRKIKVLHLASFAGNIGDIANHQSFYHQLSKLENYLFEIEKLEIRDFYKTNQLRRFDEDFVNYVNHFDLFIIGGGNFFELCWDYSETGTTFDISPQLLQKIKTPFYINAIGVDVNKGTNESNIRKFKTFLETLFEKNKVYFTVRNDGSYSTFNRYFSEYSKCVSVVPDWGFGLNEVSEISRYTLGESTRKSIGFNVAIDMADLRYKQITYEYFIKIISKQINLILNKTNFNIILFPHIQSDFVAITDLLQLIDPRYLRSRVSIAPLIQTRELDTFKLYKDCFFIYGMRFHSNVCAMSLGIPTFGLLSYSKHKYLYEEVDLLDRKVDPNDSQFEKRLKMETEKVISDSDFIYKLRVEYRKVKDEIDKGIKKNLVMLETFLQERL